MLNINHIVWVEVHIKSTLHSVKRARQNAKCFTLLCVATRNILALLYVRISLHLNFIKNVKGEPVNGDKLGVLCDNYFTLSID